MSNGSNLPVKGARPSVSIDGQTDATLTSAMLSLLIIDTADGLARCEVTFGNWGGAGSAGFQHFGRDKLEFGKALGISLAAGSLFEGRITAITATYPDGGPLKV